MKVGLCQCGCGKKTNTAKTTDKRRGMIKGCPNKFLRGHNGSGPSVIDLTGKRYGCWKVLCLEGKPSNNLHHCRWLCQCVCGKTKVRTGSNLKKSKNTKGCHCGFSHRGKPYETLYSTISNLAKRRNVPVMLSYKEYLVFTKINECHYCGDPILWVPFGKMNGHKLDRKDNSLGYSKENCVVCCPRCNRAKSDHFTYEEWEQIGALIRSWKKE